jgi:uncharacterized protein DUF4339
MPDNWFYFKSGVQHGPVTPDGMKQLASQGALTPADLVWTDGMSDWATASQVPGLFTSPPIKAPPPPTLKGPPSPKTQDSSRSGTGRPAIPRPATPAVSSAVPQSSAQPKAQPSRPPVFNSAAPAAANPAQQFLADRGKMKQLMLVGIAACLIPGVLFAVWSGLHAFSSPVTLANYNRIKTGMTEGDVEAILGPGQEQASSSANVPGFDAPGVHVEGVSMSASNKVWQDGIKMISIAFMNGKVQAKAQLGL